MDILVKNYLIAGLIGIMFVSYFGSDIVKYLLPYDREDLVVYVKLLEIQGSTAVLLIEENITEIVREGENISMLYRYLDPRYVRNGSIECINFSCTPSVDYYNNMMELRAIYNYSPGKYRISYRYIGIGNYENGVIKYRFYDNLERIKSIKIITDLGGYYVLDYTQQKYALPVNQDSDIYISSTGPMILFLSNGSIDIQNSDLVISPVFQKLIEYETQKTLILIITFLIVFGIVKGPLIWWDLNDRITIYRHKPDFTPMELALIKMNIPAMMYFKIRELFSDPKNIFRTKYNLNSIQDLMEYVSSNQYLQNREFISDIMKINDKIVDLDKDFLGINEERYKKCIEVRNNFVTKSILSNGYDVVIIVSMLMLYYVVGYDIVVFSGLLILLALQLFYIQTYRELDISSIVLYLLGISSLVTGNFVMIIISIYGYAIISIFLPYLITLSANLLRIITNKYFVADAIGFRQISDPSYLQIVGFEKFIYEYNNLKDKEYTYLDSVRGDIIDYLIALNIPEKIIKKLSGLSPDQINQYRTYSNLRVLSYYRKSLPSRRSRFFGSTSIGGGGGGFGRR
ncbi:MAG: hypothetical protein QXV16_00580 [Candidatus Anstonellales archaeon]